MSQLSGKFLLVLTVLCVVFFVSQTLDMENRHDVKVQRFKRATSNSNFTFINISGDCMLYAKRISFTVYNYTEHYKNGKDVQIYSVPLGNIVEFESDKNICSNYSGTILLSFDPVFGGPYNLQLKEMHMTLHFKLNRPMSWWSVQQIDVEAGGSIIEPKGRLERTFNGSEVKGYVEGPMEFCYACGKPQPFLFFESSGEKEEKVNVKYALNFTNLQIQPFSTKARNKEWWGFTEDVYDCVPFISIGVWMFLISVSILLFIVFCGIYMLASLKSNDRFDDIKGKPLVVNVKE